MCSNNGSTCGTYYITAADDGIRGKDSVYITDGNFTIKSTADAIKSTNEVDSGKGFVLIERPRHYDIINILVSIGDIQLIYGWKGSSK